jgi:hypothetical protein
MSPMNDPTRESIIEAAKQVAMQTGGPVSRSDFVRLSGISSHYVYKLFPDGGWSEVQRAAGIGLHPQSTQFISDNNLLAEFHRVVGECGSIPNWHKFNSVANVSGDTIRKRFGGAQGTIEAYRAWLEKNAPDSPILVVIGDRGDRSPSRQELPRIDELGKTAAWAKLDGIEYGAPINFRGLRHAPINEQGVVYLFGMVSNELGLNELGLIVEAVQAGFPDCEAKRCVNAKENRWQRVRIEFEFRSRNFLDHGHDSSGADLIVCREHNWPDCPLEVIELCSIIGRLKS